MAKNDADLRGELTELTEAVRGLRENETADEIRRLRAEVENLRSERAGGHHCHGCHCHHGYWIGSVWMPYSSHPYTITCGTVPPNWSATLSGGGVSTSTVQGTVTTNASYALT